MFTVREREQHQAKMDNLEADENGVYYDTGFWDYIHNYTDFYDAEWNDIPEKGIAVKVEMVTSPILVCLGVPSCLLTAKIMGRMSDRFLPSSGYLVFTSIMDGILLLLVCGNAWIDSWTGHDIITGLTAMSSGSCKFSVFLLHMFYQVSNWSMVCYVLSTHCHVTGGCCGIRWTMRHVIDMLVLLLVLLMCLNAQYFWTYDIVLSGINWWEIPPDEMDPTALNFDKEIKLCVFEARGLGKETHPEYYYFSAILDGVTTDFLPALLMMVYLGIIARRRYRKRREPEENVATIRLVGGRSRDCIRQGEDLSPGLKHRTPIAVALILILGCMPLFAHTLSEQCFNLYHRAVSVETTAHEEEQMRERWRLMYVVFMQVKLSSMVVRLPLYCRTSPKFCSALKEIISWWKNLCLGRQDGNIQVV